MTALKKVVIPNLSTAWKWSALWPTCFTSRERVLGIRWI